MLVEVAAGVQDLVAANWRPRLISIRIGDDSAVNLYVRNQQRSAQNVGIEFEQKRFPADTSAGEVHAAILNLNADPRVTGIILQRPIPDELPIQELSIGHSSVKGCRGHASGLYW